jgi:hypothetical protein
MQVREAAAKRIAWEGKPCEHSKLVAEYDQHRLTGDMVCVQCGKTFPHDEADSFRRQERVP